MQDRVAYKVMTMEEHEQFRRDGVFRGSAVDLADGFVHLSGERQVRGTLEKHFAGQCDLMLVAVDLDRLGDAVRWEASRGGELFPHVYGAVPAGAVTASGAVAWGHDGEVALPRRDDAGARFGTAGNRVAGSRE